MYILIDFYDFLTLITLEYLYRYKKRQLTYFFPQHSGGGSLTHNIILLKYLEYEQFA